MISNAGSCTEQHARFLNGIADFIIYVIDVAGGDKVPRKGGKCYPCDYVIARRSLY